MAKFNIEQKISSAEPSIGRVKFIAIDGHGGSGKTTLATLLSEKFKAEVIHTDDFASWDNPSNWWPLVIKHIFEPISLGAEVLNYNRSSWEENHKPEPVVNQPVADVMILEGVSSSRKEFRDFLSLSLYVDAPKEICLERGINRDSQTSFGREELMQRWEKWFEQEELYIARDKPKEYADIVVDGTRPFNQQIELSKAP